MKKIVIVLHSLLGGGSERVAVNMLKELDRKEFSITLVLYEPIFDYPLPKDIEVIILNLPATWNMFKLTKNFTMKIVRLAGLIRKIRPDIVFSLLSSTNVTLILAKVLSRTRCKVFISEHTHPSVNLMNERYGGITRHFMRYTYPMADRIITVSGGIRNNLIEDFHLSPEKIEVIYNPVDLELIGMLSQEKVEHPWFQGRVPVIVSVGRLTKQKGYPDLIRAFTIVRKSFPCKLLIIGKGEDEEKLKRMVQAEGIGEDVAFLGFQKNPFMYMARATLFVLSSLYEGFSLVLLEAMAIGLPVVSTDCPSGPSEIIEDKKNGILVPVGNEKALAGAILLVLKDEALRKALSEKAWVSAQPFALPKAIEKYTKLFLDDSPAPLKNNNNPLQGR